MSKGHRMLLVVGLYFGAGFVAIGYFAWKAGQLGVFLGGIAAAVIFGLVAYFAFEWVERGH